MSTLEKTIITTEDDLPTIIDKSELKVIVLGDKEELVSLLNAVSYYTPIGINRFVIWIQEPNRNVLKEMFPSLSKDIDNVKAFALSTKNKIAYSMKEDERESLFRADRLFIKAGKTIYN